MSVIKTYTIDKSHLNNIEVVTIGDLHLGHESCDLKIIRKYISYILDNPNTFVILLGDYLEFSISTKKVGNALMSQVLTPDEQIDLFIELFRPLADNNKILGMIGGNHESRLGKVAEKSLTKELARTLGVELWNDTDLFLTIKVGKNDYNIYMNHGNGVSIRPDFQLRKAVFESSIGNVADVVVMGHIHQMFAQPFSVLVKKYHDIYMKDVWGVRSGTALNYASYAREKSYPPSNVGFCVILLAGFEKRVVVALGLERKGWVIENDH